MKMCDEMKEGNILEVRGLGISAVKDGQERVLVKDVNFSLKKGKVLGIVGESGSGKSITCYAITGLLNPNLKVSAGSILFRQGEETLDLARLPEKRFRKLRGERLTMVFQEPMSALNPVQRCGAQVEEVLKIHTKMNAARRREEVLKLFEQVKLPDPERIYNSYPHQISGGQKQRVVIAMAISCRPDVIIADEPTTALDVTVQKEIVNLFSEISRTTDMAIIFITHDLALISEIADDILVMYQGRVEETGPKGDIFAHPRSPYTKGLLACRPKLGQKVTRLPVVADFMGGKMPEGAPLTQEQIIAHEAEVEQRAPLLRIRNVSKWYRNGNSRDVTRAVQEVNLDIYKGETLGLVGESGCGKSTLSRAILMLDPPSAGEVFYRGKDITKLSQRELMNLRKDIQIIFQDPFASLNPMLSVGEALIEPMRVHGILDNDRQRREYIAELLKKVGLSADVSARYPHQFSGGQRQRIGIARALVLKPSFIICDESVSALDVSVQALNLLNDLKEDYGFTYLFISHDLSVVQYMSDHLAVMQGGRIVEYGRTDVVYRNPQCAYTQRLMDAIPRVKTK